jgi:hypothetical protein
LNDIMQFTRAQMTKSYDGFEDTAAFIAMLNKVRGARSNPDAMQ